MTATAIMFSSKIYNPQWFIFAHYLVLRKSGVSFFFVQQHFLEKFSSFFLQHSVIELKTKKLILLFKLSFILKPNFALTLCYPS